MIKKKVGKSISKFERKYLPKLRSNKRYQSIRYVVLMPLALVLHFLDWIIDKVKARSEKPKSIDKFRNIVSGWANLAFPDKEVEKVAVERAGVCSKCPFAAKSGVYQVVVDNKTREIQGMKCSLCGCALSAKVRSINERCPDGRW